LRRVGEEVVAEVLDGLPAVPLQRTGPLPPCGRWGLAQGGHGELHGEVEVVGGDRGLGGADLG
jgi:hypothetical protein